MKNILKAVLAVSMAFVITACNDEEDKRQAQYDQQQMMQQTVPAQPVTIINQQPSDSNGTAQFVNGMVAGHVISNIMSNNNRSYNDDRRSTRTIKNKTTIVNNNTYINNSQPVKSYSTNKSSLSLTKPKSKYSNVFSRSNTSKRR